MSIHPPITGTEAADRLAIRELFDAYAHCAERSESYCLAHHLTEAQDGSRTLMVASIRYLDTFVKQDGAWLFAERRLMVNWTDTRPLVS